MNKTLKRYYWIMFSIYLILGIMFLSLTINLLINGSFFWSFILMVLSYIFLKDWWSININKGRLK